MIDIRTVTTMSHDESYNDILIKIYTLITLTIIGYIDVNCSECLY